MQVGQDLRLCLPLATFLAEKLEDFGRQFTGFLVELENEKSMRFFEKMRDFLQLVDYQSDFDGLFVQDSLPLILQS